MNIRRPASVEKITRKIQNANRRSLSLSVQRCGKKARCALRLSMLCVAMLLLLPMARAQDLIPPSRETQRALYLQALDALASKDLVSFETLRTDLADYP